MISSWSAATSSLTKKVAGQYTAHATVLQFECAAALPEVVAFVRESVSTNSSVQQCVGR